MEKELSKPKNQMGSKLEKQMVILWKSLVKATIGRHHKGFLFILVESVIERLPLFSAFLNCIDFVHPKDESKIFEEKLRLFAKGLKRSLIWSLLKQTKGANLSIEFRVNINYLEFL